ncbi:MAG: polyprenol monophosphomannose synthase [Desulfurococcales archaeon]|nr:polyprenol monophosphomannose synthase [Desulfurococcales archaeon]
MTEASVSIIVPTFNEADNIIELLERLEKSLRETYFRNYEIIVVDDNSPDGTCRVVREYARDHKAEDRIRCILRTNERGLSSAVVEGMRRSRGDIVVVMDADLQHPPEDVPRLVMAVLEEGDIAVATRYARGGGVEGWSRVRLLMSRLGTILVKPLSSASWRTTDPLSGFFAFKRNLVDPDRLRPRGFKILLEILERYPQLRVVDVPYIFRGRKRGESKLGLNAITGFIVQALEISPTARLRVAGLAGFILNLALLALALGEGLNRVVAGLLSISSGLILTGILGYALTRPLYRVRNVGPCRVGSTLARVYVRLIPGALTLYVLYLILSALRLPPLPAMVVAELLSFPVNVYLRPDTPLLSCIGG